MKSHSKMHSRGHGGDHTNVPSPVKALSPIMKRLSMTERKTSSLSASRNPSMDVLSEERLPLSASLKTVVFKDELVLPKNIVSKLARVMTKKRRDFTQMQKELLQQQNTYLELYASLRELEQRSGVDVRESTGDVRLLSVKGWPAHDLLLLVRDDLQLYAHSDIDGVIGPAVMKELSSLLISIPEEVLDMGADLMARRLEILEYLRKKQRAERDSNDWKSKNAEFEVETENLHKLLVATAKDLEEKVTRSIDIAKTSWIDRDMLIKKIDRLQKELIISQSKSSKSQYAEKESSIDEHMKDQNVMTNSSTAVHKLVEDLNKERAARESLKQVVSSAEGMLRTARSRVATLERQLKESRAQLENEARKHKEFELLHRHRETSYDVRSKKLLEVSKTGEVTIDMLSRQRDALELRVKELLDQTKTMTKDYEARQMEQKQRLESIQAKMLDQEKQKNMAEIRIAELEKRLKESQEQYSQLRETSDRLIKLDKDRCLDYLPRKENEPSTVETEIWKDLQVTKNKLEQVSEELRQSRADKENLLESLSRIAQEGPEHNMANELLNREQTIFRLQREIEDLKTNLKSLQEMTAQKDSQLSSLKLELGRLESYDCYGSQNDDIPKQNLALEVLDLSAKVAELDRERTSLVSAAATRALMLERHERCAELFAQVTRTRRELAAQLEGRSETTLRQDSIITPSMKNSLSSLCLETAEKWSELKLERERVLQLQNVVVAQNMQLERESQIRTQLEQRRAVLERICLTKKKSINPHNSLERITPFSY